MPISDPSELPGPLAYWPFSEGSGHIAKNAFASPVNSGANLFHMPEQLFSTGRWTKSNVTATDNAANNPNAVATATRLVYAAADGFIYTTDALSLPPAQYTISAYFKANAGADVSMRLSPQDTVDVIVDSPELVVTNAGGWQRKSFTYTPNGTITRLFIRNFGSAATDVLVWGVQIEAAGSASAYHVPSLDFVGEGAAKPTWSSEGIVTTGGATAIALEASPTTFAEATVYLAGKLSSAAPGGHRWALTDINGFTSLAAPTAMGSTGQGGYIAGSNSLVPAEIPLGEWHVLAVVWTGTAINYYLDGTLMKSASASTGWTSKGFVLGYTVGDDFGWTGTRGAMALYDEGHTAAEVRDMTTYLQGVMAGRSVTMENLADFIVAEGDSIPQSIVANNYVTLAVNEIDPQPQWVNLAQAGSRVSHLTSRAATTDTYLTPSKDHPILYVHVGRNDMGSDGANQSAATFVAALKVFCQARMTEGWIVVLGTVLPSTLSGFNTKRNAANTAIRADDSFYDVLVDFDEVSGMGADGDAADTNNYSDGTHPTVAGNILLAPAVQAGLEEALALVIPVGGASSVIGGGFGGLIIGA